MKGTARDSSSSSSRKPPKSRAAAALRAASDLAGTKLQQALSEFESLKDPGIRAAYGDRFLRLWATDFEFVWPMIYEILDQFKQEELFKEERRAGRVYATFAEYFEDRVKQPFEVWASLEETYKFVSQYAPDLFGKTLTEARDALGKPGRPKKGEEKGSISNLKRGDNPDYWLAKLQRDRPDLRATLKTATKIATDLGWRKKRKRRCPQCGYEW